MRKFLKIKYWLPLMVAFSAAVGMWLGYYIGRPAPLSPAQEKFNKILALIQDQYVDNVDIDSLIEMTIPGLISNLDPHSVYLSAKEKAEPDELDGKFSGIGITFQIFNDTVCVVESLPSGPAQKVGMMGGDRIIAVDGKNIAKVNITNEEVFKLLRGPKGTQVKLTVLRPGYDKNLTFYITRGDIPVNSIDASFMADATTGYIKVNKFSRTAYGEFIQSLADLTTKGARNFIIDLRGNTGGYMEPAIMMVNEFLNRGDVIVGTKGRQREDNTIVASDGSGSYKQSNLIVLTDENTASSSEIFSGAIQDNDRGLIVGRRSYGKGLVQRPIPLDDGSEIRLTVQRYYTPSGRCIQKDYTPGQNDLYQYEIYERFLNGETQTPDSAKIDKNLLFKTVSGRKVYGGGGIMPDVFMPTDTTKITNYYKSAVNEGLLMKFAYEFCDLNRADLSKAHNLDELRKLLPSDGVLLQSFVHFAAQNGLPARWYYINISQELIVKQIKALIARDILGIPAYYEVMAKSDQTIQRSLELLHEGKANFPLKP